MIKNRILLYLSAATLFFNACEKIVELDIPSEEDRLVVEAQITNVKDLWKVKLSTSQKYFNQNSYSNIKEAAVTITEGNGTITQLTHQDSGWFFSADSMECAIGETYTLRVIYNGKEHIAAEQLANGFPIDIIETYYLPDGNGFIQEGYYVFIKGLENDYKGDSYLWRVYKNDTFQEGFGNLIENDEFGDVSYLNKQIDPINPTKDIDKGIVPRPFPFILEVGDEIRIEQFNLSPMYYQYLIDLSAQQSRSGSPFDPPPANPTNNISNGGLGYFSVAHMVKASVKVKE